jgi:ribosomal-protein-alanine N-acetyltransferase
MLLQPELSLATLHDLPAVQAMGSYYVYDMSEYLGHLPGWKFPPAGAYECDDLGSYFSDPAAFPYLIKVAGELAGFAIVDRKGSDPAIQFNMAQFFIHRKFKGQGIGTAVADECFRRHAGLWSVMVIPENRGALAFWRKAIGAFTGGLLAESREQIAHLGNSEQCVFRFSAR